VGVQVDSPQLGNRCVLGGEAAAARQNKGGTWVEEKRKAFGNGKMNFADALQVYKDRLEKNPDLKLKSKYYYRLITDFIVKSWPELVHLDIRKISEHDCKEWLVRYRQHYAPSVVNNSIGVLQAIFKEAVDVGARGKSRCGTKTLQSAA
jgi:hypothetical protein